MTAAGTIDREGFELKKPVLVCRWRLSHRRLPLKNRHMRALLARTVNGRPVDQPLAAWVKQHIEWTLDKGASEHPDGVLLFVIDAEGQAAMAVGPYASLEDTSLASLVSRAARARQEAMQTGVSPETLWVATEQGLVCGLDGAQAASGATSLVLQLAKTMGTPVQMDVGLIEAMSAGKVLASEVFLVSDEHGIVPAANAPGPQGERMAQGYQRLLASMDKS